MKSATCTAAPRLTNGNRLGCRCTRRARRNCFLQDWQAWDSAAHWIRATGVTRHGRDYRHLFPCSCLVRSWARSPRLALSHCERDRNGVSMTVKDAMAAQVEMYKRGGEGLTSAVDCQPFLFPRDLFLPGEEADGRVWTCARTRPRWEKKFAEWLRNRHQAHFLPVFRRVTISHRKRQISELPLFSGFVFVVGDLTKKDLPPRIAWPTC